MDGMKETHTKHHPIRVDAELWETFGRLVGTRNRSAVIREFIRWFVRESGAQLPVRPGTVDAAYPDDYLEVVEFLKQARDALDHGTHKETPFSSDQAVALTPRELEVLFLVASDKTPAEVSMVLNIGLKTVYAHIKSVAAKIRAAGHVKIYVATADVRPNERPSGVAYEM